MYKHGKIILQLKENIVCVRISPLNIFGMFNLFSRKICNKHLLRIMRALYG